MGSPKALLPYGEETFLGRLCRLFQERCADVVVVLGAGAGDIAGHVPPGVRIALNEAWQRGQTGSLQCGLRSVPADAAGVLFTLVDHPAVTRETIDALLGAPSGKLLRVPRYRGRRGHPIWFARELIAEFLALSDDGAARDVVRGHAAETGFLDLDDPGVVADIDDPETYRSLVCARS